MFHDIELLVEHEPVHLQISLIAKYRQIPVVIPQNPEMKPRMLKHRTTALHGYMVNEFSLVQIYSLSSGP